MRFLLDENMPKDLAVALRDEGHDVVWLPETERRGARDLEIWRWAHQDRRVLVTADLDFPMPPPKPSGMILVRNFDRISASTLTTLVSDAVHERGEELLDKLVVLAPGRVRVRPL